MAAEDPDGEPESGRSKATDRLWADVRIDPVEIALPGGVGYTLRAYRAASELTAAPAAPGEDDEPELDDFDAAAAAVLRHRRSELPETPDEADEVDDAPAPRRRGAAAWAADDEEDADEDSEDEESDEDDDLEDDDDDDEDLDDEDLDDEEEDEDEDEEEEAADEEVPVFLGRRGRLYLFHSPDKLVEFVKSAPEHDLSQLDSWPDLVSRISTDDVVALPEDTYELDLVVANLRGGPDAWDAPLILKAGELARDLGHALRIPAVMSALGAGSPLDDLDEALRAADSGGVGGFFAKRKLRKAPAQQSSLAWRTVIGKIAAVADWRD